MVRQAAAVAVDADTGSNPEQLEAIVLGDAFGMQYVSWDAGSVCYSQIDKVNHCKHLLRSIWEVVFRVSAEWMSCSWQSVVVEQSDCLGLLLLLQD